MPEPSSTSNEKFTLLEHLFEIRTRLIRAFFVFLVSSAVCYLRSRELFDFLAAPAEGHLVFTHPVDGMMAYIKLGLLSGLLVSAPYILYQVFAFFKPALGPDLRRRISWALSAGYVLFTLGVAFAFKVLPLAMHYLLTYSRPGFEAMLVVNEYFGFVFLLAFGSGFAFELPLLMYFLATAGIISSATLLKHWRMAIMVCLILGAMICPTPDLITWGLVCLPLFGLYAVSIVVVRWAEAGKRGAAA